MFAAVAVPLKATMLIGSLGILAQIAPIPSGSLDSIGRVTLDGALIVAVGVLWKALLNVATYKDAQIALKDAQIAAIGGKVTETLVLVLESVKENRRSSEELRHSSDDIGVALDNLSSNIAALPCALNPAIGIAAEKKEWTRLHGGGRRSAVKGDVHEK